MVMIAVLVLPSRARAPVYAQEMAAVKAITTIHTAETQYYSRYGHYAGSLTQLGPPPSGVSGENAANLIDRDLASGNKGDFKFALHQTPTGYALVGIVGKHAVFSDQRMTIHRHRGEEPATVNDPLLGEVARAPLSAQEMAALKAIGAIQNAETRYILGHGDYTDSLAQLRVDIHHQRVVLRQTKEGCDLTIRAGNRTFYSDQTMMVHDRPGYHEPLRYELIARQ
jgi:type IV pilus assembly protein PilA